MKRLLFTAMLWTVALHAQGRMGGAVHSSSSAPARSSAPHYSAPSGGNRATAAQPGPASRTTTARPVGSPAVARSFTGIGGNRVVVAVNSSRFHHRRHFRPAPPFFFTGLNTGCFNSLTGDPFFCNGFYNPHYSSPIFPYNDSTPAPAQPAVLIDDSQSRALSLEVDRLSDEIDQMRDENRRLQREQEQDRPQPGRSESEAPRPAGLSEPPRVLVFKDGHQILAENYAVSGSTIWVLDNGKVKKIPMSEVDMAATQKANADTDLHLRH
jgi:hypothetical protein